MRKVGRFFIGIVAWILATESTASPLSYPSSPEHPVNTSLHTRQDIPEVPERPSTSEPTSFHGSRFEFLKETGFEPAVDAMPVFLFSRTMRILEPCYPEGAIQHLEKGDPPNTPRKPNHGTKVPGGMNPGKSCMDPGPYYGAYSFGKTFPVYVTAKYCPKVEEWWINYDVYYVHDGVMSVLGHRHDWESITIIWKRDAEGDWWHREAAVYSNHEWHYWYNWTTLVTVDVDKPNGSDVRDDIWGTNKKHPKAYIGFFSHASFPNKNDRTRTTAYNSGKNVKGAKEILYNEYRSDDWWYMPRREDIHPGEEIPIEWKYGHATSTPMKNKEKMCDWELDYV